MKRRSSYGFIITNRAANDMYSRLLHFLYGNPALGMEDDLT
ncbi:hypothetical protein DB29_00815 [Shouchella clausii]|nr:hypothetical protein DB29_00815 [Shouchella clausii]